MSVFTCPTRKAEVAPQELELVLPLASTSGLTVDKGAVLKPRDAYLHGIRRTKYCPMVSWSEDI